MSSNIILIIGCVYLYVGLDKLYRGDSGLGIAFLGYAFSNVGLFMAAK
jgi:TM2 domain-containing membrane protein YozV